MTKWLLILSIAFLVSYIVNKSVDWLGVDQGIEAIVFIQIIIAYLIIKRK